MIDDVTVTDGFQVFYAECATEARMPDIMIKRLLIIQFVVYKTNTSLNDTETHYKTSLSNNKCSSFWSLFPRRDL